MIRGLFRGANKPGLRSTETPVSRPEFERMHSEIRTVLCLQVEDMEKIVRHAIGQATRVLMAKLHQLESKMSKLDDLLGAVEAQQTKIDSLIALTDGLHKAVLEAMGDTITPSQAMRIAQVFDAVKTNSDEIDAALVANTVQASAGAISDGPGLAEIRAGEPAPSDPAPQPEAAQPSTEEQLPAT